MDKKLKIGIIFENNKGWIAGTYYYLNIIRALNTLPDNRKPVIVIISKDKNDVEFVFQQTQYPCLQFIPLIENLSLGKRLLNKIWYKIFKRIIFDIALNPRKIDCILCVYTNQYKLFFNKIRDIYYWIPDFQEHFLPEFFSANEIMNRKLSQVRLAYNKENIILSSKASLEDFKLIYPGNNAEIHILPFAVILPEIDSSNFSSVKQKFLLPEEYFLCPNQFWQHKNQIVILQALKLACDINNPFNIIFTGAKEDYRNKNYFQSILEFISRNQLEPYVKILGFIDRNEQLLLLKYAKAIIQPSLFEGWSTIIEESKALSKQIICSDLAVHKEQLEDRGIYFKPHDPSDLLKCLMNFKDKKMDFLYQSKIENFRENILQIFDNKKIINGEGL
jgi:glycosyltransferase involved in cell wall biosynthesis